LFFVTFVLKLESCNIMIRILFILSKFVPRTWDYKINIRQVTILQIVGQRTSLTSTDDFPLSVVSGIQFNLETKQYSYGLTGIAFINTLFSQTSPQKLSSIPSPSPNHPNEVEVPQALQQNVFQISIFFCKDGRCQF
jgi:hypothetical protein